MSINFGNESSINEKTLLNRVTITLFLVACSRLGTSIPIAGIDQKFLYDELKNSQIINFVSSFSQGNFFIFGLLTLGILPNINASIVTQLLTSFFPPLKRLQNDEGESGRIKVAQITRYLTILIALQYSFSIAFYLKPFIFGWNIMIALQIAVLLSTGAAIMLWFSEIITEKGIGNGTSLFIFVNISSSLPDILNKFSSLDTKFIQYIFSASFLAGTFCIITIQKALRKISLVSLKSLMRKINRRGKGYLPFRLNPSGIMPLIFTSAFLNGFFILLSRVNFNPSPINQFAAINIVMYFLLTLFFSYFYSTVIINPVDLSNDLKKLAFNVPTTPPGIKTIQFLRQILSRLALIGGLFLALVVSAPILFVYLNPNLVTIKGFGLTSLLILVGVTVDLSRQIQTYQVTESYDSLEG